VNNLLGETFGKLTVIAEKGAKCQCQCECGNVGWYPTNRLLAGDRVTCGKCPKGSIHVGDKIRNWLVMFKASSNHWHCKCDCGNEKDILGSTLLRGKTNYCSNCRPPQYTDITGQRFGSLVAIKFDYMDSKKGAYWIFRCDCGNERIMLAKSVKYNFKKNGKATCGECRGHAHNFGDLSGQKVGKLSIAYHLIKYGRSYWHCKCDCGKELDVAAYYLKHGQTSCGCEAHEKHPPNYRDRTGERQGMLTMLYPIKGKYHTMWHCRCDCGNELDIDVCGLNSGQYSCGCADIAKAGSSGENEIKDYLLTLDNSLSISRGLHILDNGYRGLEIDMYMKNILLGIEYNGSKFHASLNNVFSDKECNYHQFKFLQAKKQNIHLISIFDVDWQYNDVKIKSYLSWLIKQKTMIIDNYTIKLISSEVVDYLCAEFYIGYRIGIGDINYGIYVNEKLMGAMSFSASENNSYKIKCYCINFDAHVDGLARPLLEYFYEEYHPITIYAYSDNDWFSGDVYANLGFIENKQIEPNYYWYYRDRLFTYDNLQQDYPEYYKQAIDNNVENIEDYILGDCLKACKVYRSGITEWVKTYKEQ